MHNLRASEAGVTSVRLASSRANAKSQKKRKIQPVAVSLDALPERRTMTIHPEISARGSLIPAGDGSKLLSDTCPPGTRQ